MRENQREREKKRKHSSLDPHFACTLFSLSLSLPFLEPRGRKSILDFSLKICLEAETRARTRVKNILSSLLPVSLRWSASTAFKTRIRRRQTCSPLSLSHPTLLIVSSPEICLTFLSFSCPLGQKVLPATGKCIRR